MNNVNKMDSLLLINYEYYLFCLIHLIHNVNKMNKGKYYEYE